MPSSAAERTEMNRLAMRQLEERCEAWKALALANESLLVCYRIGKQPSGKLLDEIGKLKERLGCR